MKAGTTAERMGAALAEIESAIRRRHAEVGRVFVEMRVAPHDDESRSGTLHEPARA